jgi:hypothetical protein
LSAAPEPALRLPRVVQIGFNKCGTRSFQRLFEGAGHPEGYVLCAGLIHQTGTGSFKAIRHSREMLHRVMRQRGVREFPLVKRIKRRWAHVRYRPET